MISYKSNNGMLVDFYNIIQLRSQIGALYPIDKVIDNCIKLGLHKSENLQILFVDEILNYHLFLKFPISQKYIIRLIKILISKIEDNRYQISNELLGVFTKLISGKELIKYSIDNSINNHIILEFIDYKLEFLIYKGNNKLKQEDKYKDLNKDYMINKGLDSKFYSSIYDRLPNYDLKEKVLSFIFKYQETNELGMRPWDAGIFLAERLISTINDPERSVIGKDIIELGSGIGVAAIIASKLCSIRSICTSDYNFTIINNLKYNFSINGILEDPNIQIYRNKEVEWYKWNDEDDNKYNTEIKFNMINKDESEGILNKNLGNINNEISDNTFTNNYTKEDDINLKFSSIYLDWETFNEKIAANILKSRIRPLIMASDVIYDKKLNSLLVKTIQIFLSTGFKILYGCNPPSLSLNNFSNNIFDSESPKYDKSISNIKSDSLIWTDLPLVDYSKANPYCMIINAIRCEDTLQDFVDKCYRNGLTVCRDPITIPRLFYYEVDIDTIITFIIYNN
ncbi:uncharacterized protein CMU_000850 [Cryptosporidium muris RN66]|uniref:Uncharacterized protein n=1 Tax=Cryptosporidium muris (strain RN66) TaxID=441375 RepID=B6AG74_CRYMR|nr:uncharacterized protein CMU_000850 [Cryptosporidium muris RN66]EEA07215.1 hypothetical protein, conserved [Cryptosporidium muris RN66]|eukprot:XP_002141564.1 hypothetical protein [Cryptosporidium muris RN66]